MTHPDRNPLASWATIVDCGDAHLTWLDNKVALQRLDKAHRVISLTPPSLASRQQR
jgi:agmatinase